MQCKDVESVVEQEGLAPLPQEVNTHLAQCRECRNYIADLTSIVDVARKMPSEITPPDRIWISIRAQLELEGIIREPAPVLVSEHSPWRQGFSELFRDVFGEENGIGARSAVGMGSLPGNISVEIEAIFELA